MDVGPRGEDGTANNQKHYEMFDVLADAEKANENNQRITIRTNQSRS